MSQVFAARPQQLCPGFGAICTVFGKEGVTTAAVGLSIERTIGLPTDVDRAIQASGEGSGPVIVACTEQLGPGFGTVDAVFGQEGVVISAVGITIKSAKSRPTGVDRAIESGGEGPGIVERARPLQLGPGYGRC